MNKDSTYERNWVHLWIPNNRINKLKLTREVIYHLKRQPYFFLANPFLKQGSEYVMVDFICKGLLEEREQRITK